MYEWRKMTQVQQAETLEHRRIQSRPWHSPPHIQSISTDCYMFTAACFEHASFIGHSLDRLKSFEISLLEILRKSCASLVAWVVLPNHYHALAHAPQMREVIHALGKLHGRSSFLWNREENECGRKCWHCAAETVMKSEAHYWATLNYIHHNPVKHGYVKKWTEWPFSSAGAFLDSVGREKAEALWREYPIASYGKGWDD